MMRGLLMIVAAGCGGGEAIATADIGAQILGVIDDAVIDVSATLTTADPAQGPLRQIAAADGDRLIARAGGAEVTLEPTSSEQGTPIHLGRIAGEGSILEVAFERRTEPSAPASSVLLPAPFELIAPPSSHIRGAPLSIDWEIGEADTLRILLAGRDCVVGAEVRFDEDLGTATIDAGAFERTAAGEGPCVARLQVDKLREGSVDPAFGRGGRIEAVITRAIELTIED